jgi:hypothetical protein
MSPEAAAPTHEPFTVEEYIKIRELSDMAIGSILEQHPYDQVSDFCYIAENEFELHGDQSFVKKNLDAALERVPAIDTRGRTANGHYVTYPALARTEAYLAIASAAHKTEQEPEYVSGILDTTLDAALESAHFWLSKQLDDIAKTAYETGQGTEYMKRLVERMYEVGATEPKVDQRFAAIGNLIENTADWGLDEDYRAGLIERAHGDARAIEDPEDEITSLLFVAAMHFIGKEEKPGAPDKARVILDEIRKEIPGIEDPKQRFADFSELAEISAKMEQPSDYVLSILKQCLKEVLSQDSASPETVVDDVRQVMDTSLELLHLSKMEKELTAEDLRKAIINISASEFLSDRDKHKLLNRTLGLLGGAEEVPEEFLEANGIVKRPFNFAFSREPAPLLDGMDTN